MKNPYPGESERVSKGEQGVWGWGSSKCRIWWGRVGTGLDEVDDEDGDGDGAGADVEGGD